MSSREQPRLYSVDFRGCTAIAWQAPETVAETFQRTLEDAGATVVRSLAHAFPGTGLTCVLILAESHAVLHTWPETGTVNVDIFSCSTRLESLQAIAELGRVFGAAGMSIQEVARADGHASPADGSQSRRAHAST